MSDNELELNKKKQICVFNYSPYAYSGKRLFFFRPGYSNWRDIVYFAVLLISFVAKALTRGTSPKLIKRSNYMTGESAVWSIRHSLLLFKRKVKFYQMATKRKQGTGQPTKKEKLAYASVTQHIWSMDLYHIPLTFLDRFVSCVTLYCQMRL